MPADTKLSSQTAVRLKHPRQYKVVFYNDDFTPMDVVVDILVEVFHKSYEQAVNIMMSVHKNGTGVAGVYSYDIAMTKTNQAVRLARQLDYPLRVEAEEA